MLTDQDREEIQAIAEDRACAVIMEGMRLYHEMLLGALTSMWGQMDQRSRQPEKAQTD